MDHRPRRKPQRCQERGRGSRLPGAIGVGGDLSDKDEEAAFVGIAQAGLIAG